MATVSMLGLPGGDVSNPAAFGWEWSEDGTRLQIVGLRGVSGPLMLGMMAGSAQSWTTMRMHEEWSGDGTRDGFLGTVRRFLEASKL